MLEHEEEERFFSQPPEPEDEDHTSPSLHLLLPELIERRARLRRRVAWWLGLGSSVILLAALWRHRIEFRPITSAAPVNALPIVSAAPEAVVPSATPVTPAPAVDAAQLLDHASSLLAAGRTRDGVVAARAAVDADPRDARAYVLLAAGLEDLGDWPGARAAFRDCRKQATRGPSSTCNYFARR